MERKDFFQPPARVHRSGAPIKAFANPHEGSFYAPELTPYHRW